MAYRFNAHKIFFLIFFIILLTDNSLIRPVGGKYRRDLKSSISRSVFVTDDVILVSKSIGVCYPRCLLVGNKSKMGNKKPSVSQSETRLTDDILWVAVVIDDKGPTNVFFLVSRWVPTVSAVGNWPHFVSGSTYILTWISVKTCLLELFFLSALLTFLA